MVAELTIFSAFRENRRFVTVLTAARHLTLIKQLHILMYRPIYLIKIRFNITLAFTAQSPKLFISFRFPD
jgi:hypothetical protein